MVTIKEIIYARLSEFGLNLSTVTIDSYITETGIDSSIEFTKENAINADKVLYSIIPLLLVIPKISEGNFSREIVVAGLTAYYKSLCLKLGLSDKLSPQPIVKNASNRW
jgi:hypothetical protein